MQALQNRIEKAFLLTNDLLNALSNEDLDKKLLNLPSNSIRSQLWCVIGARESYMKAILSGKWSGFVCSIDRKAHKKYIVSALIESMEKFNTLDFLEFDTDQLNLAFDLLEHEIQHHGQLIRYMYANNLDFPKSWNDRYTV